MPIPAGCPEARRSSLIAPRKLPTGFQDAASRLPGRRGAGQEARVKSFATREKAVIYQASNHFVHRRKDMKAATLRDMYSSRLESLRRKVSYL